MCIITECQISVSRQIYDDFGIEHTADLILNEKNQIEVTFQFKKTNKDIGTPCYNTKTLSIKELFQKHRK